MHVAKLKIARYVATAAKTGPLRIAIDTKPILGRGGVEDTYNLLARGIKQLCQVWGRTTSTRPEAWAAEHDLGRHFTGSIIGQAGVDWSDAAQRRAFLQEIVTDARRLLRYTTTAVEPLAAAPREPGSDSRLRRSYSRTCWHRTWRRPPAPTAPPR